MELSPTLTNNALLPPISSIPVELWNKIFSNLECKDIKSVRLSWRKWTSIALAFLFKPFFTFRADRRDFDRFDRVYKNYPQFPQMVTALRFETCSMDVPALAKSLGFKFMQMHNIELYKIKKGEAHDWDRLKKEKDAALCEYAAWRMSFDNARQDYTDESLLATVFSQVYRLDHISVSRKDISWKSGHTLLSAWVSNEKKCYYQQIEDECRALMFALARSGHQIKHFSHDQLPVKFVASLPRSYQHNFMFEELTTLHLTFEATEIPIRKFWNRAGIFVASIPTIKDLRFGFAPLPNGTVDYGVWYGGALQLDWYVPLWKVLGTVWPNLESLRLDGMLVCEEGLWKLLDSHSGSLSKFVLSDMALISGSFKSLLQKVRTGISLKEFCIGGITRGIHTDIEHWVLPPVYDEESALWHDGLSRILKEVPKTAWNGEFGNCGETRCLQASKYPSSCMCPKLSADIQNYVLKKEGRNKWPAKIVNKNTWLSGELFARVDHSSKCSSACLVSQIARTALFDDEFSEEDDVNWEEAYNDAFEQDENGVELVAEFDEDGYDEDGFDVEGFNGHRISHKDITTDWQGVNGITTTTASREVLNGVCSRIPALSMHSFG